MAKLTTLRPRLKAAAPRIRITEADRDAARAQIHDYRGWYKLVRWHGRPNGLRWRVLVRDSFTCQMCQRLEHNTSLLVADHKIPHKGDAGLFWSESNVWCLCKPCHDGAKQREERRGQSRR